ncbi:hypothetical protein MTR67_036345 [Solanum verrucosum]|uniref:Uncharacterized protein n=1 Tax=Solanum verrucosum TaxID=315347 RepID=A0AAF0UBV5_SOLVR|nr:hypothetical protein MTR67_036345 [Solanum verrucosum]
MTIVYHLGKAKCDNRYLRFEGWCVWVVYFCYMWESVFSL